MKTLVLATPNDGVRVFINPEKITFVREVEAGEHIKSYGLVIAPCTEIGFGCTKLLVLETPEEIIEKIKELKMNTEFIL